MKLTNHSIAAVIPVSDGEEKKMNKVGKLINLPANGRGVFAAVFCLLGTLLILFSTNAASAQEKSKSPCVSLMLQGEHDNHIYEWKDQNSPLCQEAVGSLRAASIVILGEETGNDYYHVQQWLVQIADSPKWNAKFNEGFNFGAAANWFKEYHLSDVHYYKITREIYGRDSTDEENKAFESAIAAKKTWYALLFFAEKEKLNSNPAERELMIARAYQKVFNRRPNNSEMARWRSGKEIYRELIAILEKEPQPKRATQ